MKIKRFFQLVVLATLPLLMSCRGDDQEVIPSSMIQLQPPGTPSLIKGFYLLNEGNMGSNKSSIDYFDYTTGYYRRNMYAEVNPSVTMELGDVGNDIQVYGNKLYAVINVSGLVEVMDVATARHLATIKIPNCRYIVFNKGKAYVSSYAGPVSIDPNARLGYIAEIDTISLKVTNEVTVGYQPEEMVALNNKLYVANSGGYRVPNYDNTVSVIDLNTFTKTNDIEVAINLHRMKADAFGTIYVTSRGDYENVASDIYMIDSSTDKVTGSLGIAASELCICNDLLYLYGSDYNRATQETTINYAVIDTRTKEIISHNFITDGTDKNIERPYGIAVNPETQEILITDAKSYTLPGTLYCFTPEGKKKWSVTTGDIPAHFAFVYK